MNDEERLMQDRTTEGVGSVGLLVVCLFLLACFTVNVATVVGMTLLLIGAYRVGRSLLRKLISFGALPDLFIVVLSTTVGLIVVSLVALVLLPVIDIQWSASLLFGVGILIGLRAHLERITANRHQLFRLSSLTSLRGCVALLFVTLVFLSRDFRWANPAAIGLAIALLALSIKMTSTRLRVIGVAAGGGVFVFGLTTRSEFWWFVTNDHHWFEALAISTVDYGPWDSLGINMDVGLRYHFLAYLISGTLSKVLFLDPFISLTRVLPVLIALAVSATVISLLNGLGRFSSRSTTISAASIAFILNFSHASPSHTFSMLLLLLTLGMVIFGAFSSHWVLQSSSGVIWAIVLALAKASAVLPVLLGIVGLWVLDVFRKQRFNNFIFSASFAIVSSMYVLWQIVSDRTSGQLQTGVLFGYAYERMGDLQTLGYSKLGIASALLVTSSVFVPICISAFLPSDLKTTLQGHKVVERLRWFALPVSAFGILTAVLRGNFSIGYFVTAALYVMIIPALVVICRVIDDATARWGSTRTILLFLSIPIAAQLLRLQIRPAFNGGSRSEIFARAVLYTSWILPAAAIVVLCLTRIFWGNWKSLRLASLFVIWSFGVLLMPFLVSPNTLEKGPELKPEQKTEAIGSTDEISVGTWLRLNTSKDAVFATNHFCGAPCAGSGWFERDLNLPRTGYRLSPTPTAYGGANFFLAIYSERRFLVQGPYHLLTSGVNAQLLKNRVETALEFAETSSQNSKVALLRLGATHMIVDRSVISRKHWPGAREVFRNSTFSVLELTT